MAVSLKNISKIVLSEKEILKASQYLYEELGLVGELSIVLVQDEFIRKLNNSYRGIDKATDVLTFPASKEGQGVFAELQEESLLGEIFINLSDCKRPEKYLDIFSEKKSFDYLLYFLIAHGILHLANHNDDNEKDRLEMIDLGKNLLTNLLKKSLVKKL